MIYLFVEHLVLHLQKTFFLDSCFCLNSVPTKFLLLFVVQKKVKYTHGAGKSVFRQEMFLLVWLLREVSRRILLENRLHSR